MEMLMLVLLAGQQRTEAELSALIEQAGLRLTEAMGTSSVFSTIEAVPG